MFIGVIERACRIDAMRLAHSEISVLFMFTNLSIKISDYLFMDQS